jgi:hypothetical protein
MSQLRVFYRLSDKGEKKEKLPQISNRACLENFMAHFSAQEMSVIADNVSDETFAWLETYSFASLKRTQLGNSASFWECYTDALALPDDASAYFVENDYLHRAGARAALLEGLTIADYVTLYDHPDKYYDGVNPLVRHGGEVSRVNLTASCHWKTTNSTTMTFAAKVATLGKDRLIFKNFTVGTLPGYFPGLRRFQRKRVPGDFPLFRALARLRGRTLASPIPAFSTHGETAYIAPFFMDMLDG